MPRLVWPARCYVPSRAISVDFCGPSVRTPSTLYAATGLRKPFNEIGPRLSQRIKGATMPFTVSSTRISTIACVAAQSGSKVHAGTDRGVIKTALEADPSSGRLAMCNSDPETHLITKISPFPRQLAQHCLHIDRHMYRSPCRIGTRQGRVEEGHEAIPGEAFERCFVLADQDAEDSMIFSKHLRYFFRRRRLGERRVAPHIAK